MEYLFITLAMIVGLLFGFFIGRIIFSEKPSGNLKLVFADEKDPYVFLELGLGMDELISKKSIHLNIVKKNITQK